MLVVVFGLDVKLFVCIVSKVILVLSIMGAIDNVTSFCLSMIAKFVVFVFMSELVDDFDEVVSVMFVLLLYGIDDVWMFVYVIFVIVSSSYIAARVIFEYFTIIGEFIVGGLNYLFIVWNVVLCLELLCNLILNWCVVVI